MLKKVLISLALIVPSFLLGGYSSLYLTNKATEGLNSARVDMLNMMHSSQHVRLEEQLDNQMDALEHFIDGDKSGVTLNKSIKTYILSTSNLIDLIEENAAGLKKESYDSVMQKVVRIRERLEYLKFGYNF